MTALNTDERLGLYRETVCRWYNRGLTINREWEGMLNNVLNETGHAGNKLRRKRLLKILVADNPRCGAPAAYTLRQYTDIVKIAMQKPSEYDRPITHWTARELTDEVHKQQITLGISQRQVQRFLSQADLKPHKSRYWLNQVEIWFSILARKVLKRGNFVSTEDLRKKLEDFISYFNRTMGKPFKWTYKGKPLSI